MAAERLQQQWAISIGRWIGRKRPWLSLKAHFCAIRWSKRFEITFEMAWKTMYRFCFYEGETHGPKAWDVLPVALESLLIADARLWDQMREYRNDTSHEYDENKAVEIAAFVRQKGLPSWNGFSSTWRASEQRGQPP